MMRDTITPRVRFNLPTSVHSSVVWSTTDSQIGSTTRIGLMHEDYRLSLFLLFILAQFSFLGTGMVMAKEHTPGYKMAAQMLTGLVLLLYVVALALWVVVLYDDEVNKETVVAFSAMITIVTAINSVLTIAQMFTNDGGVTSSPLQEEFDEIKKNEQDSPVGKVFDPVWISRKGIAFLAVGSFLVTASMYLGNVYTMHDLELTHNVTIEDTGNYQLVEFTDEWRNLTQIVVLATLMLFGVLASSKPAGNDRNNYILLVALAWLFVLGSEAAFYSEDDESKNSYYDMNVLMGWAYVTFAAVIFVSMGQLQNVGNGGTTGAYTMMGKDTGNHYM